MFRDITLRSYHPHQTARLVDCDLVLPYAAVDPLWTELVRQAKSGYKDNQTVFTFVCKDSFIAVYFSDGYAYFVPITNLRFR